MKKKSLIFSIILLSSIIISGSVFAQVVTTQRKQNTTQPNAPQYTTRQYKPKSNSSYNRSTTTRTTSKPVKVNRLTSSLQTCKPYTENMKTDYLGMNFTYQIRIEGWINNKCRLNFVAKPNGASDSFKELYGVDASDARIRVFAPRVRCDFTRQQLAYVGDSILQEQERNRGARNNMLKDPKNISFNEVTASDMRLLDVILNQQACQVLNSEEYDSLLKNITF